MGQWCLHASSFIFDQIIIKVASNQDRHKSSDELDFGPLVSMAHLYVFWNDIWRWHIGLRWAIVDSHSSESIHIWTIGTLEGRLSFHDSWPRGWCPGVGLEVKIQDTFKKCFFSTFLLCKQLRQIITSVSLVTLTYRSWSKGEHDLYFTVQWFCLISGKTFLIYEHHTSGLWISMTQHLTSK